MKNTIKTFLVFIIPCVVLYIVWSFCWLTLDFSKWSEAARVTYSGCSIAIWVFFFGINYIIENYQIPTEEKEEEENN